MKPDRIVPKRLPLCAALRVEQGIHIALREGRRDPAITIEQAIGERPLSGFELVHLFLDRPGGHEPVNEDGLVLPNPIGPIDRTNWSMCSKAN